MREIKFRAWDGEKFGYISIGYDRVTWPSPDYFEQKFSGLREGSPEQVRFASVECFQQFTGLHDKNGEPIYEGDVVRVIYDGNLKMAGGDGEVRQVIWGADDVDEYYPAFDLKGHDMETNALSVAKNNGDIEVIGNICKSPELIKT